MTGRTKKSARNVKMMMFSKVIYLVLNFISRTFFIKYLGTEYLGINGLFTNVLTILSFAELGIGNAIIFKLYKPVANNDREEVKTLLHFYKRVYYIIGIFVFGMGLIILPFIKWFINSNIGIDENIYLLFFLFLLNTSLSYFFTFKRSIVIANQDEYLTSITDLLVNIIAIIVEVIALMITKNYIVYLLLTILFTFSSNLVVSIVADKKYPYITENNYEKISKKEKKNIFNDVKSIVLYKMGFVLSNGTDNIIISKALGVAQVGLLSNYTMIISGINGLLGSTFNSLTGSIGNLNTIKESKKKESVFYEILCLSFVLYGIVSICVILLSNVFIKIWLGEEYLLSFSICIALGFNLYVDGMRFVCYTFRNTAGLFKKGRCTPLISSISNIIISIILVNYTGIFGVLIATGLTRLFILTFYDPLLLHKNLFHTSVKKFYIKYFYYLLICSISLVICSCINNWLSIGGIIGFITYGILDILIVLSVMLLFTFKSEELNGLKNRFFKKKGSKKNV